MSEDKKYTESDVREFAAYYSLLSKDETDFTLFRHFEKWEASKQPVQKERIEVTDIWAVKEHDTNNPIGFRVCCTKLVTKDKIPEIKNLLERYLNGEMDNPAPSVLNNDTGKESSWVFCSDCKNKRLCSFRGKCSNEKQPTPSTGKQDWEITAIMYNDFQNTPLRNKEGIKAWLAGNEKNDWHIHEVKRLSDNTTWVVGEDTSKGIIKEFNYRPDINELYLEVVVGDQNTLLRTLSKLPPIDNTSKPVTDNSDVSCLSLNDLLEIDHSGNGKILTITYEKLMNKLKEKLSQ